MKLDASIYANRITKSPSSVLFEETLKLDAFKDNLQHIVSKTGTEFQIAVNYLKEKSKTLAVVSAVKGEMKKCFSADQGILKLIFTFDHMNYVRYICISTCTLN